MSKNFIFLFLGVAVLLGIGGYFLFSKPKDASRLSQKSPEITQTKETPAIHEHAGFAIFANGLKRDFTASKYHNLDTKVHLHESNTEIIHKHVSGVTWGDFFNSLPMKLTNTCLTTGTGQTFCNSQKGTLKFYLNGQKVDDSLRKEIKDGDTILITYGLEDQTQVNRQFSQVVNPQNISLDPKE